VGSDRASSDPATPARWAGASPEAPFTVLICGVRDKGIGPLGHHDSSGGLKKANPPSPRGKGGAGESGIPGNRTSRVTVSSPHDWARTHPW